MTPMHHDTLKGGKCPTEGFCKADWAKKKLREFAACLGILCAAAGGGAEIPKAIVKLAQAACCATDKKAHDKVAEDIKNKVKVVCAGGDAG